MKIIVYGGDMKRIYDGKKKLRIFAYKYYTTLLRSIIDIGNDSVTRVYRGLMIYRRVYDDAIIMFIR